jgi:hypothetical protein
VVENGAGKRNLPVMPHYRPEFGCPGMLDYHEASRSLTTLASWAASLNFRRLDCDAVLAARANELN